jgi:hypothetical protein
MLRRKGHVSPYEISWFFSTSSKIKKDDLTQVGFLDGLMLLVVKGLLPMGS